MANAGGTAGLSTLDLCHGRCTNLLNSRRWRFARAVPRVLKYSNWRPAAAVVHVLRALTQRNEVRVMEICRVPAVRGVNLNAAAVDIGQVPSSGGNADRQ